GLTRRPSLWDFISWLIPYALISNSVEEPNYRLYLLRCFQKNNRSFTSARSAIARASGKHLGNRDRKSSASSEKKQICSRKIG
ncbi:MAG: hypothetical protein AAFY26_24205, partial [Cyanobacteria bacterium J06638_22]